MPEYGHRRPCEVEDCVWASGAPLNSIYTYGCVLCPNCQNEYQLGERELPDSASEERREEAEDEILGITT